MMRDGEQTVQEPESIEAYLRETDADKADVYIYGVKGSAPRLEPLYDIDDEVPGVEYRARIEDDMFVYQDDLDTFLDDLPGSLGGDVEQYIKEKLGYYGISADTWVVNDTDLSRMEYIADEVIDDRFNLVNPVDRLRYLSTQLERADDRICRYASQDDAADGRKLLERERKKALARTGVGTTAPAMAGIFLLPEHPQAGAVLLGSSAVMFAYQPGAEGKRLRKTFRDVAATLDGTDQD